MLENATELKDATERGLEAAAVLTALVAEAGFRKASETRPAGAGRVSDHGPRACVESRVAFLVPGVNAGEARVHPVLLDVERGHDLLNAHSTTPAIQKHG